MTFTGRGYTGDKEGPQECLLVKGNDGTSKIKLAIYQLDPHAKDEEKGDIKTFLKTRDGAAVIENLFAWRGMMWTAGLAFS